MLMKERPIPTRETPSKSNEKGPFRTLIYEGTPRLKMLITVPDFRFLKMCPVVVSPLSVTAGRGEPIAAFVFE
jgi:hypothetical protein